MSTSYSNYSEYLKNKHLNIIRCDPNLGNISNIKNYPNYKQYTQLLNCIGDIVYIISPGLHTGQTAGLGQPTALRLYDPSGGTLLDFTEIEQKAFLKMLIDDDNNIKIKCINDSSYTSWCVWTFIFNIKKNNCVMNAEG